MRETLRQLVHLLFGLAIAALILVLDRTAALAVLSAGLFVGLIIIDLILEGFRVPIFSRLVDAMERQEDLPGKGSLFFTVSALFCLVFFDSPQVFIGILVLSVLDAVTTIVGLRFGRMRVVNEKSVEGTLAGAVVTAAVLVPFLPLPLALATSAIAAIAEHLSPVDDNLVIPPVVCLLLAGAGWPAV
jgi:phytol kinase